MEPVSFRQMMQSSWLDRAWRKLDWNAHCMQMIGLLMKNRQSSKEISTVYGIAHQSKWNTAKLQEDWCYQTKLHCSSATERANTRKYLQAKIRNLWTPGLNASSSLEGWQEISHNYIGDLLHRRQRTVVKGVWEAGSVFVHFDARLSPLKRASKVLMKLIILIPKHVSADQLEYPKIRVNILQFSHER